MDVKSFEGQVREFENPPELMGDVGKKNRGSGGPYISSGSIRYRGGRRILSRNPRRGCIFVNGR